MPINRRRLILSSTAGAVVLASPGDALAGLGIDAAHLGVRPGAPDDQSVKLQRAIDHAARKRVPLMLAPGHYRASNLHLTSGAQIVGVRGATSLTFAGGPSLLSAEHAETITLSGLTLDGGDQPLPARRGLVHLSDVRGLRITDCSLPHAGGDAIHLLQCDGIISGNLITDAADSGLFSNDSRGLIITGNSIRSSGNGGIRIWQSEKRHDGSLIADNIIEDTKAVAGGNGPYGNAINIFRAADVIVHNNTIRRAAFTAIRGNSASNIQIIGNNCTALHEVAIYSEFSFEGAVIAANVIDGAALGVSVTNLDEGGHLAVVQGNIIRNLVMRSPQGGQSDGIGIAAGAAETVVTGNVIENAPQIGIVAGFGPYLRNVNITSNVVRKTGIGIGVSVVHGAGPAMIANNLIADARRGAIIGMEWHKSVTGDLVQGGAERYPQLSIHGNQVS